MSAHPPRRRTTSHSTHAVHHPLKRVSSHTNTAGIRSRGSAAGLQALTAAAGAGGLERKGSRGSDEGTVAGATGAGAQTGGTSHHKVGAGKHTAHGVRRRSSHHTDDRPKAFRSARSDTHLAKLGGGMTTLPERRPSAKKTRSDDKTPTTRGQGHGRHQSVDVLRREEGVDEEEVVEEGGDDGAEEEEEEEEEDGKVGEKGEVKQQQPSAPARKHVADLEEDYSDDGDEDDDDDDDEDDSDHLIIKRKGSKAPLPKTQTQPQPPAPPKPKPSTKAPSPAPLSRVRTDSATNIRPNPEQVSRSAGRDRSRSRSRQMPRERQKARRTSSSLERFKRKDGGPGEGQDKLMTGGSGVGSGVFARTKSQIGFEVPGEDHVEEDEEGKEDLVEYAAGRDRGDGEGEREGERRKSRLDTDVKRLDGMKNYQLGSGTGTQVSASAGSHPKPTQQHLQPPAQDESNAQLVASPMSDETMQVPSSISNAIGHPDFSSRHKPATPKLQVQTVPPVSAFNLEESPKAGFPFPAPAPGAVEGTGSDRLGSMNSGDRERERAEKKVEGGSEGGTSSRRGRGMEPSPGGSETGTLIGSTASMPLTATPRLSAPPSAPPESTTSAPVTAAPSTRHIRTRDSHTSLRSLASIRNAGPPPHPLSSPRNARTSGRVTSLSVTGRQGSGIAAPQLNKEEARGLWSGSPTESSHLEEMQSQGHGHERQKSVDTLGPGGGMKRSNSSRSILDTFGFGGGKGRDRDGDKSVEALRKASFSSTVGAVRKGTGKEGTSSSAQRQMSGHSHRLSAHSVAQAAARLPTTPAIATTAYGNATNENSQVGLVSRFLAVTSWNPKPPAGQQRDRNGKGRAYTTPNSGAESPRRSVFPESPFAAAHASLVRTMMEEGARPASTVQGYGSGPRPHRADSGPLPRSNTPTLSALALTPAYDNDNRGKASARDANKASKDNTLVLGLTPFEMSIRRCLDQRKGAVKLSTGGPLGPLPP